MVEKIKLRTTKMLPTKTSDFIPFNFKIALPKFQSQFHNNAKTPKTAATSQPISS
jgi:hypothetical protein